MLPGVQVTLTSPVLLQPLTATTSETGSFQFPRLDVGTYTVKFELAGFKTVVKEGIQVTVGFSAQRQHAAGRLDRAGNRHGHRREPDRRHQGDRAPSRRSPSSCCRAFPSARDPWVILQQTAGIAMDRENIGGNMSGQQSNYVSRGGNPTNNKWSLDGVDITDMAATGASPSYYDFDAFQEMTINTGGVDVTQQTGGVGINLVTKSGTDRFKRLVALLRHRREVRVAEHHRRAAHAGRDLGQPDPEHQGLRLRGRRPDQEGPRLGVGQLRQAERRRRRRSASTSRRRRARRSRRRRLRWPRRSTTSTTA